MGSIKITESLVSTVSKGPLVIFLLMGLGIWQASLMSEKQIETIERLITILNNSVGAAIFTAIMLLLIYALVLFPSGKFIAGLSQEFIEMQKAHNKQHEEHVEASKGMFRTMTEIQESCKKMQTQIDKFYGGES